MGTINGHARPVVGLAGRFADHTSVTCSGVPRKHWVCCGVPPAGTIICSALGSTSKADCLSTPATALKLNDTTGLLYGVTGVCHQAANRILSAAGLLINNKCNGIKASVLMYGLAGLSIPALKTRLFVKGRWITLLALRKAVKLGVAKDFIVKQNACFNISGDLTQCIPAVQGVNVPPPSLILPEFEAKYLNSIFELLKDKESLSDDDLHSDSMILLVTQGLIEDKKEKLKFPILDLLNTILDKHTDIIAQFVEREIDTRRFVDALNENAINLQSRVLEIIGPKQYTKTMNAKPEEFYNVVDLKIAQKCYGKKFTLDKEIIR